MIEERQEIEDLSYAIAEQYGLKVQEILTIVPNTELSERLSIELHLLKNFKNNN